MVLMYISQMTNDFEHLLMSSFAICISSLVKCLFKYLTIFFKLGFLFDVFLLNFESSPCVLETISLSEVVYTILISLPFYKNFRISSWYSQKALVAFLLVLS